MPEVSVRFRDEELDLVGMVARGVGMSRAGFIRQSAIEEARLVAVKQADASLCKENDHLSEGSDVVR